MILTIFLVGIGILCIASKMEEAEEQKKRKEKMIGDRFIRELLYGKKK